MSKRRILTVLLTASAVWLPAALRADDGETVRPVFSAYTLEAGSAQIADTYLTPLKYNGQHFGIDYQRWQAMKFDPQRWVMQLDTRLTLNHTVNPAGNATMWDAMLEFRWAFPRASAAPHQSTVAPFISVATATTLYRQRRHSLSTPQVTRRGTERCSADL